VVRGLSSIYIRLYKVLGSILIDSIVKKKGLNTILALKFQLLYFNLLSFAIARTIETCGAKIENYET
jgi:hypothetical protein